ncbi:putative sugar epimerase YhfK [Paraconexibacter sp. AEG42_29]|uniref:Sugar epimerase YhfK n=1 Tax=Paraconexibacter sp. AEG42_29 TaxID=2997339 RepID=A0AAU7B311_9ACTN
MDVVIAGAHGAIGRRLTRLLAARGDRVRGLLRNPDHVADVESDGGIPIVCDLESATLAEVATAIDGADAVVFAAGAGAGSGAARKLTVDRDGAILLAEAAQQAQVARYVIVSAVGAEDPPAGDEVFSVYLQAKAAADAAVMASALAWTVLRPGLLTDDAGTGSVRLDLDPYRGEVTRDDVAAVLDAVLHGQRAVGRVLYVNGGEHPVETALDDALR